MGDDRISKQPGSGSLIPTESPVSQQDFVPVCKWCAKTANHRHQRCATREDGGPSKHVFDRARSRCPECNGTGGRLHVNCGRCSGFGWLPARSLAQPSAVPGPNQDSSKTVPKVGLSSPGGES